ncbi:tripartite tricarboxylate transporter TctB family protein [Neptunicoccus cionae]|uniref:tripartite tricarboxylate transporter TctB family protein n=1 Tax=Neptunicoccus cionae TaxID=2035344 RepID=UPI000C78CE25|nr:tripartite tricarboxylate transporter TctB family protein [Amylibacter cionae]PLS21174.1 hypothetical protein C0U40_13595 [Amylibacter cionae]
MTRAVDKDRGAKGRLDFQSGVVLMVASLFAIFWLIPRNVPGAASRGEIAPSTFPYITAFVVLACATALVATNWKAYRSTPSSGGSRILLELAGWVVFSIATLALFDWLGFVAAGVFTTLCAIAVTRYRQHKWLLGLIALGLPLLLKLLVWQIFSIQLP